MLSVHNPHFADSDPFLSHKNPKKKNGILKTKMVHLHMLPYGVNERCPLIFRVGQAIHSGGNASTGQDVTFVEIRDPHGNWPTGATNTAQT
jgi:hypothetical protein